MLNLDPVDVRVQRPEKSLKFSVISTSMIDTVAVVVAVVKVKQVIIVNSNRL